jgi:hypothetical protein
VVVGGDASRKEKKERERKREVKGAYAVVDAVHEVDCVVARVISTRLFLVHTNRQNGAISPFAGGRGKRQRRGGKRSTYRAPQRMSRSRPWCRPWRASHRSARGGEGKACTPWSRRRLWRGTFGDQSGFDRCEGRGRSREGMWKMESRGKEKRGREGKDEPSRMATACYVH